MKLEVGMYVRYIAEFYQNDINKKIVKIGKIIKIENGYIELDSFDNRGMSPIEYFKPTVIGEPSFNPIDLIEVGDYVNGSKVEEITELNEKKIISYSKYLEILAFDYESDIKTILTHEQFENNCYKIGNK